MRLHSTPIARADERRHQVGPHTWWGESWGFELAASDASFGGFVQITVYPRRNIAWFWAAVVGEGRSYVLCRDHDLRPPSNPDVLELRGEGLWTHAICETPLEHWTVAMEAFAVELADPFDAWKDERGDRVGLAFDLEWESVSTSAVWAHTNGLIERYEVPCVVNGVLQIGDETLTVSYEGWRQHSWGVLDWSPSMLPGTRANVMGERPRSNWFDEPSHTAGEPELTSDWHDNVGRNAISQAPLLVDRPDGSTAKLLRTLDQISCEANPAPGWSERLVSDGI